MAAKPYVWEDANDRFLRANRGISFDDIVDALNEGLYEVQRNWSRRHPGQRVFIVQIKSYPWAVPFDETPDVIVLRTAYPSRRLKPRSEP
jgi:hypothetical protein